MGVDSKSIASFQQQLQEQGRVLIPHIALKIKGEDKVFSLMSTYTTTPLFPT